VRAPFWTPFSRLFGRRFAGKRSGQRGDLVPVSGPLWETKIDQVERSLAGSLGQVSVQCRTRNGGAPSPRLARHQSKMETACLRAPTSTQSKAKVGGHKTRMCDERPKVPEVFRDLCLQRPASKLAGKLAQCALTAAHNGPPFAAHSQTGRSLPAAPVWPTLSSPLASP